MLQLFYIFIISNRFFYPYLQFMRVFPIKLFTTRTAELFPFIGRTRNEYHLFTFIATKSAQYFISFRIFGNRSFSIIINFPVMNLSAMYAAVNLSIARCFKNFTAYRTNFIH